MIVLFGLNSCNTCRRARQWLDACRVAYRFVDLREQPPSEAVLDRWINAAGYEALLNRRSRTWRALASEGAADDSAESARRLMLSHPTLIKRPVFDIGGRILVGFTDETRTAAMGAAA